jgi:hypothetical protein
MSATVYLIRVEGVNQSTALFDTDDISTGRGGSAMLRDAPTLLWQRFPELKRISQGASVALYRVHTADPDRLVERIAADLAAKVPHITYVVDAAPLGDDFASALDEVTARNHFRQFQQLTVAIPEPASDGAGPCEFDRIRPANARIGQGKETKQVSAAVYARREVGIRQRKELLQKLLDLDRKLSTTSNLVALAEDNDARFGNLGDKRAVLYADGNSFGKTSRKLSRNLDHLRGFDERVQGLHKAFLRTLLERAQADPDFTNHGDLRLEMLLWGGDELMLIVPAWRGMETLQLFFEAVAEDAKAARAALHDKDATARAQSAPAVRLPRAVLEQRLTYAAGLIFCSANTPIAEIVRNTKALAERVKAHRKRQGAEPLAQENRFDYLVLESVDYPTQSIDDFRALHFGAAAAQALAPLAPFTAHRGGKPGDEDIQPLPWAQRVAQLSGLLESYPRGAIRNLAQTWLIARTYADSPTAQTQFEQALQRFEAVNGQELLRNLHENLFCYLVPDAPGNGGPDHAGWLHLTELWDYLAPQPATTGRSAWEARQ